MEEEMLDVLDKKGNVTGKARRSEVHAKGLIHRTVMFFVLDPKGRVFVNQRAEGKEFYGGYWSIVLGGHVSSGQTYEEAVLREAQEEAGIKGVHPHFIGTFKKKDDDCDRENVMVYSFTIHAKPVLDTNEIKQGAFMTIGELEDKMRVDKFLPETGRLYGMLSVAVAQQED